MKLREIGRRPPPLRRTSKQKPDTKSTTDLYFPMPGSGAFADKIRIWAARNPGCTATVSTRRYWNGDMNTGCEIDLRPHYDIPSEPESLHQIDRRPPSLLRNPSGRVSGKLRADHQKPMCNLSGRNSRNRHGTPINTGPLDGPTLHEIVPTPPNGYSRPAPNLLVEIDPTPGILLTAIAPPP